MRELLSTFSLRLKITYYLPAQKGHTYFTKVKEGRGMLLCFVCKAG